jgi:hypothetical protein
MRLQLPLPEHSAGKCASLAAAAQPPPATADGSSVPVPSYAGAPAIVGHTSGCMNWLYCVGA